jgi:hypothetical protein
VVEGAGVGTAAGEGVGLSADVRVCVFWEGGVGLGGEAGEDVEGGVDGDLEVAALFAGGVVGVYS